MAKKTAAKTAKKCVRSTKSQGMVKKAKKVSKKATSTAISKLNDTDEHELASLINKTGKEEKAFDNLKKYHSQDLEKKESSNKVESDLMKQLELIGDFNI